MVGVTIIPGTTGPELQLQDVAPVELKVIYIVSCTNSSKNGGGAISLAL